MSWLVSFTIPALIIFLLQEYLFPYKPVDCKSITAHPHFAIITPNCEGAVEGGIPIFPALAFYILWGIGAAIFLKRFLIKKL